MLSVDQCQLYVTTLVLLSHLSVVTAGESRDRQHHQHRRSIVTEPTESFAEPRHQSSTLHDVTAYSCPSSSSLRGCTCSLDLVVRCRGQNVDAVPQFPPATAADRIVLAELNMAGANVRELQQEDFLELRMRRLVLTENQLGGGLSEYAFSSLGVHLTSLMLGACAIRTLPARLIVDLSQLQVLHLWSNRIENIPDNFFMSNSALYELSLWGNRLQTLQNRTFYGLVRLRILDLDRNRINTLERNALSHVSGTLEVLRLSSNNIYALSESTFSVLRQLRILTLASNRLRFVDARTFLGLNRLQSLSLANNRIQFLADGAFDDLLRLRTLDLSGNRLERIWAGTFVGLSSLSSVDLSRNSLRRLPDATFSRSPVLRRIVLDDNRLSTLGRCSLSSHGRIRSISLIGNAVQCDCRLAWISRLDDASATSMLGSCVDAGTAQHRRSMLPVYKSDSHADRHSCALQSHQSCLL